MADNSTTITCGTVGKPCKSSDDYPVCHPKDGEAGWVGLEEVIVCEYEVEAEDGTKEVISDFRLLLPGEKAPESCKTARPPNIEDDGETRYTNENELATLLNDKPGGESDENFLTKMGLKGVCQAPYLGDGKPTTWYAYVDNAGHAAFLTLHNKGTPSILHDQDGIWLSYAEMMGLASCEKLNLQQVDVVCSSAPKLKREEDEEGNISRTYKPGRYHFKKDKHSLERILEVLRDDDIGIDGFDGTRRKWLIRRFERIHDEVTKGDNTLWWIIGSGAVTQLIFIGAILFQDKIRGFFSRLFPSIEGDDIREETKEKIKDDTGYRVKGLREMAIEAWRQVDNPKFRHLIIHGKTGSGKDMLKEEMIRLLVTGDEAVPENIRRDFKDAPITGISPAQMQEQTQYRGSVSDKVMAIVRKAEKGPRILDIREFDHLVLSGGSSSGDSEKVSNLILKELERPIIRKNLIILASTARMEEMMITDDNLVRRFEKKYKPVDSLSAAIENLDGPAVQELGEYYRVSFGEGTVEAAGKLAESVYRPSTVGIDPKTGKQTIPLPRYAAIEKVLMEAARNVRDGSAGTVVTVDHVIEATEILIERPLDQSMVEMILDTEADFLITYDFESAKHPVMKEMAERPEYRSLQAWERAEYGKAIRGIMSELLRFGELGRFYDAAEMRFLEGKFEVLAEASRKGGRVTMAELTKAAEVVERTNPKAAKDAKDTAAKFAKEMAKKK
jgi:hypothetical protein